MADLTGMLQAAAGAGGDYQIERSLRFNSADSAYLSRTPASAGNRKTWTWSGWVKKSALSPTGLFAAGSNGSNISVVYLTSTGQIGYYDFVSSSFATQVYSTPVYRDFSAWYHVVVALDTTQATDSNRVKIYVNGVQVTALSPATYPTLNSDTFINSTNVHTIGKESDFYSNFYNGYLADINFIDGQALTPSSFGEVDSVTGVWKPIAYAGTYGTNGFHLDFSDNTSTTTLGYDAAGSNDWTLNNFSVTAGAGNDSLVDSPTQYGTDTGAGGEVRGNYATLNALDNGGLTLTNGNLDSTVAGASWKSCRGTIAVSSGKWYWEGTFTQGSTAGATQIGIAGQNSSLTNYIGYGADGYGYSDGAFKYNNNSGIAYGASYTTNDVIGVALDMDAGTLTFYKNGSSQGQAYSSLSGTFFPAIDNYNGSKWSFNFGQRPFAHTPPSGFKALCTTNLPDPTVVQGDDYFNTVLYSGNSSTQSIATVGFQPDWVWIKQRSSTESNNLYDAVRGATKGLESNSTAAEFIGVTRLTSFDTNGFSLGSEASVNGSGQTYVAWNWKANGAGVSNTDGTITSTVSANTTAGISIVTYTGTGSAATVGHGLGAAPSMIIVKNRDQADAWQVYHAANTANPETDYLVLNTTAATADAADRWNDTAPTSTVFSIGNGVEVNTNTEKYVAYCFAPISGFSAMGAYTGNNSADGPFIFTGFRPAFVLIKCTTAVAGWIINDSKRPNYNVTNLGLTPSGSDAEFSAPIDILSNGFKLRNASSSQNDPQTYIYMAFAENPFKNALAR